MPAESIAHILEQARVMKRVLVTDHKKTPHLTGKSIVTLFYENSTRTRMSFELASKYMSAASANITAGGSSVEKGESLIDTGRTLDRMGTDVIIMRHPLSGAPHLLSRHVKCSVINAGDGFNEHPTQALLDMLTMEEKKGGLKGLRVAIIGDVLHSRVARSNMWGLKTMGADVVLAGPPTLMPAALGELGYAYTFDVDDAVRGADVVMALRIQRERQASGNLPTAREYAAVYGINDERLSRARPDALIMHPGPLNRGVEMTSDVADCDRSAIDEQVTNGVAVRMALMYMLTRSKQAAQ